MALPKKDPPLLPLDGSSAWFQSDPDLLTGDPAVAGLMVRIGMAVNALSVHLEVGHRASKQVAGAVRYRDNIVSLVMAASLAFEAKRLASQNQPILRPLLDRAGRLAELQPRMGQLLAGTHPASAVLERARNHLGFHWDYNDDLIGDVIGSFSTNEKIVWVERSPPGSRRCIGFR